MEAQPPRPGRDDGDDPVAPLLRARDQSRRVLDELQRHHRGLTDPPSGVSVPQGVAAEGAARVQSAAEAVRRLLEELDESTKSAGRVPAQEPVDPAA